MELRKKKNTLIYIAAYNSEKTIDRVISGVRSVVPESFILVVDDGSKDRTVEIAKKLGVYIIKHKINKGYGGSQKTSYKFAVKNHYEKILMIHGDGQHNHLFIPKLLGMLDEGYDLVMGSRMKDKISALKGKMPPLKFVVNIFLSTVQNFVTGLNLSEYHSGYRAISVKLLKRMIEEKLIDKMSNDYIFDQQFIFAVLALGAKIGEIPVSTIYEKTSSHMSLTKGIKYSWETMKLSMRYLLWKKGFINNIDTLIKLY